MTKPTDAELREMVVEAMNDLQKWSDEEVSMDSGVTQPTPGDPADNMYGDLMVLGLATCLLMRRSEAMKGESDESDSGFATFQSMPWLELGEESPQYSDHPPSIEHDGITFTFSGTFTKKGKPYHRYDETPSDWRERNRERIDA